MIITSRLSGCIFDIIGINTITRILINIDIEEIQETNFCFSLSSFKKYLSVKVACQ